MDGHTLGGVYRAKFVHRLADDVEHAAQGRAANGHGDRTAEVDGLHAAHHAFGRLHGDAAHAAFAELLLDFEDDVDGRRNVEAFAGDAQRRVDGRQRRFGKLHVHRGTCDLNYVSDVFSHKSVVRCQLSVVSCQLRRAGRSFQRGDQCVQHASQIVELRKQAVTVFYCEIPQFRCDHDLRFKLVQRAARMPEKLLEFPASSASLSLCNIARNLKPQQRLIWLFNPNISSCGSFDEIA